MILSLAVFSLQKTKSAKHPLIIWAWLIFNFLQSVISMIFDLRSILSDHEYIGFAELTDLSTLVICTYLFAISARGKIGITLINSSITEPLLSPSAAQQTETKRTCLFGRARINRCLEEGPEEFLLKPVQPSDVSRLCSRVLR